MLIIRLEGVIYKFPETFSAKAQFNIHSKKAKCKVTKLLNILAREYVIVILRTEPEHAFPAVAQCWKDGVEICARHYTYLDNYRNDDDIVAEVKKQCEFYKIDLCDTFYCDCSESAISLMRELGARVIPVTAEPFDVILQKIHQPQSKSTQTMFQLTEETPLLVSRNINLKQQNCTFL